MKRLAWVAVSVACVGLLLVAASAQEGTWVECEKRPIPGCSVLAAGQVVTSAPGTTFKVSLGTLAALVGKAAGDPVGSVVAKYLVPDVSVTVTGAVTGRVSLTGCEECCSGEMPRLAVLPVISTQAVVQASDGPFLLPSQRVWMDIYGPIVLDARTEDEASNADGKDLSPLPWDIGSKFTIKGKETTVSLAWFGIPLYEGTAGGESGTTGSTTSLSGDVTIAEVSSERIAAYCACAADDAAAGSVLPDSANTPPVPTVPADILLALDGTTTQTVGAVDPNGDTVWIDCDTKGMALSYAFSFDRKTGTMSFTSTAATRAKAEARSDDWAGRLQVLIYDLKEGVVLADGARPTPDQYHHEVIVPVDLRFVDVQAPQAIDVDETVDQPRLIGNLCTVQAKLRAQWDDAARKDPGWRMEFSFDPAAMSDKSLLPLFSAQGGYRGEGFPYGTDGKTWEVEIPFAYGGVSGCPSCGIHPRPGTYRIPFEVFLVDATGTKWFPKNGEYIATIPNTPPRAVHDLFEDTSVAQGASPAVTGNLLTNDVDPDTCSNAALIGPTWSGPLQYGWLEVHSDGSFIYTPDSLSHNYVAQPETFTYTVSDGNAVSNQATAMIIVHTKPVAWSTTITLYPSCPPGVLRTSESVTIGATDADCAGDPSRYRFELVSAPYGDSGGLPQPSSSPEAPTISIRGLTGDLVSRVADAVDGSRVLKTVTTQLDGGFSLPGAYAFEYRVTDPEGLSGIGSLIVVVRENVPPVAEQRVELELSYSVLYPEMQAFDPIWYETGCLKFTDPDRDSLSFRLGRFPTKGQVNLVASGGEGTYSLTVLYTIGRAAALAAHRGVAPYVDGFTVVAEDPCSGRAETTVRLSVTVLNNNPTCGDDAAATPSNAAVNVAVLANDTDPEDDPLTVAAVSSAGHGTVALGGVRASAALHGGTGGALASAPAVSYVTYTPAKGFFGRDTFTYTVSDGHGGTATGTVTVEVTDAEPPVFAWAHPEPDPIRNDPGVCGAVVTWDPPVAGVDVTDNVGVPSLVASHAPGSVFPVGTTTVTYTAKDPAGNAATTSFEVVVEDCELPGLDNVPADIVTAAAPGTTTKAVTWVPITATDNCGVANVTALPASGTAFPIGATKVIVTALDVHGNLTERSFTVTVNGPLSIAADNVDVLTEGDGETVTYGALTGGGCPPVVVVCDPESGSFFPLGTTTVDVTATDACGAQVEGSFTVTVIAAVNQAPIARTDYAQLGEDEILVSIPVLANDEDPEGDRICIVDIGAPPCGETYINPVAPDEVIFEAIGCGDYFGSQIWFTYTIEDEHGERATAKAYVRIPDEGTLPRAPQGGG